MRGGWAAEPGGGGQQRAQRGGGQGAGNGVGGQDQPHGPHRRRDGHSRLTLGAWSWAGIAGILATFDTDLTEVRPPALVRVCRQLAHRYAGIAEPGSARPG
ncbi:hypothetical protein V1227_07425 [Lentzea sp. DG1S-22]|uniref:hypothetical protein n=1 Tax=Lentzea sp. DG1S-22 TaxID=3108822 RepID=UPI002E798998|nr:hypothetical protein [Lentzea sp. DG1S-22]WVH82576.1 hypothetical protein V1227_07425 [Lentzea sp. DG1S-22]